MGNNFRFANQKEVLTVKNAEQLLLCGGKIQDREIHFEISIVNGVTFKKCDVIGENLVLENCSLEDCDRIDCTGLKQCVLINCDEVNVHDGHVDSCQFTRLWGMSLQDTVVSDCRFAQIGYHEDVICMEDSQILKSTFSNIGLSCKAYLIDAVGDCIVEDCEFFDCRTDREDLELIHCEEMRGKLFKRKKKFDITCNCSGLDSVKKGSVPIEIGSFELK